jgi:hypothetical protein
MAQDVVTHFANAGIVPQGLIGQIVFNADHTLHEMARRAPHQEQGPFLAMQISATRFAELVIDGFLVPKQGRPTKWRWSSVVVPLDVQSCGVWSNGRWTWACPPPYLAPHDFPFLEGPPLSDEHALRMSCLVQMIMD